MNSALIIRGGSIGDFILTLPALHAFRDRFPDTRLELLGYPHIAELACERFYTKVLRSLEHRTMAAFFASRGRLDDDLSRYFSSFDLVVSYLYDPDEVFQNNLRRAGVRRVIVADCRPKGNAHAITHLSRWLAELEISGEVDPPRLYPSEADRAEALKFFPSLNQRTVALHPGSGSPSKNWPVRHYLELAEGLRHKGFQVLVVTGLADSEVETVFWKDVLSVGCLRCCNIRLPVLAAVLQQCAAFVGNDSGISHIAAAVNVSTLAIFGTTDPKVWQPCGKAVRVLCHGTDLSRVSVEDVKAALEELLANRPA